MYEPTRTERYQGLSELRRGTLAPVPTKYVVEFFVWRVSKGKRYGRPIIITGVGTTKDGARTPPDVVIQRAQQNADVRFRRRNGLASGEELVYRVRSTQVVQLVPSDVIVKRRRRGGKYVNAVIDKRTGRWKKYAPWSSKRTDAQYNEALGARYDESMESDSVQGYLRVDENF